MHSMTSLHLYFNSSTQMIQKLPDKLKNFIKGKLAPDLKVNIPSVSLAFVQKQLTSLLTGHDGFSAKCLRLRATVIAAPLTKILNMNIATGIFSDAFTKAKVTPCFKKGDKNDKLSKIIGRHVAENLKSFLKHMIYSMSAKQGSEATTLARLP